MGGGDRRAQKFFCFLMLIVVGGNLQPLALSGRPVNHRGYSLYADLCNCYIILPVNNYNYKEIAVFVGFITGTNDSITLQQIEKSPLYLHLS